MSVDPRYEADVAAICSHRHDLGADHWTTPDRRLGKGAPFSTLESVGYLLELGVDPTDPLLAGALEIIWESWLPIGAFRLAPAMTSQPCHTTAAAIVLCRAGMAADQRMSETFDYLLDTQWLDSGWRCHRFPFGRGPETEHSNPHPTLMALDAFRYSDHLTTEPTLDAAVRFLLDHWETRTPIGPCHYGIGTLFMQPEYPFRTYNLFYWVWVLSFYESARSDPRFIEAFAALTDTLIDGQVVVRRVVPKLATLRFCAKGAPSELATRRYLEIVANTHSEKPPPATRTSGPATGGER
ncbi:MAG: prenyltransferase [Actinobacteria bacterium]|nr:prenyltransferase [Actinomycetota bacterium]